MRIEAFERVEYEHNPLAEVVCQVAFGHLALMDEGAVSALRPIFSAMGYSETQQIEVTVGLPAGVVVTSESGLSQPVQRVRVYHFSTPDGTWKISISPDFIALTCIKYSRWNDFLPRMLKAAQAFASIFPAVSPTRIGLRYRDVVEREALGLEGKPWHELISPFLLGPMAPNALANGQTPAEEEIDNFVSQAVLKLDSSMAFLQSSLLRSVDGTRRAFMIDADFFVAENLEVSLLTNPELLNARLQALHQNAGGFFRRGITDTLHHALRPR